MKRLTAKLRRRGGFSLAELLVALLVLTLLTSAGAMGVVNALNNRAAAIQAADAEILGSTASQVIADELRFGRSLTVSEGSVTLDSATYGPSVNLRLDNGRLMIGSYAALGDHAYSGLTITQLTFHQEGGMVKVTLAVGEEGQPRWSGEFSVAPLNAN